MKAYTVYQPYAYATVAGLKHYETRPQRTSIRGRYSPGRFAWVLQNPVMFDKPIPARGKQGWWNWEGDAE